MGAFFSILTFTHALDIILFFLMSSFCISIILKFGIALIVKYTDTSGGERFSEEYDDHIESVRVHINKLEKESMKKIANIHNLEINKIMQRRR